LQQITAFCAIDHMAPSGLSDWSRVFTWSTYFVTRDESDNTDRAMWSIAHRHEVEARKWTMVFPGRHDTYGLDIGKRHCLNKKLLTKSNTE